LRMLTMRKVITSDGDTLTANPADIAILRYYANSITHLVA
jgi:hypothetical protein